MLRANQIVGVTSDFKMDIIKRLIDALQTFVKAWKAYKSRAELSRVLPTSRLGYHVGKPIESVVYCLKNILFISLLFCLRGLLLDQLIAIY